LPTLLGRVAAIVSAHRIAKQPLDTRHAVICETLRGIARTHGEPPQRSAVLATYDIKRLVATCGTDLTGLRDRALLLLGFPGAVLTPLEMRVLIARSKTDKAGEGVEIGIARDRCLGDGGRCVVEACPGVRFLVLILPIICRGSSAGSTVKTPRDPQRDGPCAIDAGKQQERNRARNGIGRERLFGNHSARTGDQARSAEDRHDRKESPVGSVKRADMVLAQL